MNKQDYLNIIKTFDTFDYEEYDYLYIKGAIDAFLLVTGCDDELSVDDFIEITQAGDKVIAKATMRLLS